jgi:hypothetical protein
MKVGDRVVIYLDEEIKKAESGKKKDRVCPSVLELWKKINGKTGTIDEIMSDEEIWVYGRKSKQKRMFNKDTLKCIPKQPTAST